MALEPVLEEGGGFLINYHFSLIIFAHKRQGNSLQYTSIMYEESRQFINQVNEVYPLTIITMVTLILIFPCTLCKHAYTVGTIYFHEIRC